MATQKVTIGLPDGAVVPEGTPTDGYVIASDAGTPTWTEAAAGGGLWTAVADTTLGVATAQVDVTIADAPSMVRVRIIGRSTETGATIATNGQIRLNNDSTSNRHIRATSTDYAPTSGSSGSVILTGAVAASQTNTDRATFIECVVSKMSGGYPLIRGSAMTVASTASGISSPMEFFGAFADGTQNITALSFLLSSGSWAIGSRFIVEAAA